MRIGKREIKVHRTLNYTIASFLLIYLMAHTMLDIADQLALLTVHVKKQPENGCNGHPELCNRRYSNITQIATHDSAFVGVLPASNQNVDVPTQLDAGIRFLQAQTHQNMFGKLSLCHTSCVMKDAGLLKDHLEVVRKWLDKHPKEVVTFLLTNGDNLNVTDFDEPFQKSGITKYAYVPPTNNTSLDSWPTLGEMIAQGTRFVAFLDYGANPNKVPYISDEWTYFWETAFDTIDPSFSQCALDRPAELKKSVKQAQHIAQRMYIMNHFLDTMFLGIEIPDRRDATKTNALKGRGSIGAQAQLCIGMHGRPPSAILVDYFDKGKVIEAQNMLNGI